MRIKNLQQQDGFHYTLEFAAPNAPTQMDEDGLKLLEEAAKKCICTTNDPSAQK